MTYINDRMTEMEPSWLIQRLRAPKSGRVANSFGGGLPNGGISTDVMEDLRTIFSFDYMGAAEFEFGSVPKALRVVVQRAERSEYRAWSFEPELTAVDGLEDIESATIYVIAPTIWSTEVEARITQWASERWNRLKETTYLSESLRDLAEARNLGWFELDNGFFFFVDREMFEAVSQLLEIRTKARKSTAG
jgi:hypothetical protein